MNELDLRACPTCGIALEIGNACPVCALRERVEELERKQEVDRDHIVGLENEQATINCYVGKPIDWSPLNSERQPLTARLDAMGKRVVTLETRVLNAEGYAGAIAVNVDRLIEQVEELEKMRPDYLETLAEHSRRLMDVEGKLALLGQPVPDVQTGTSVGNPGRPWLDKLLAEEQAVIQLAERVTALESVHPVGQRGVTHLDGDGHVEPAPQAGERESCPECGSLWGDRGFHYPCCSKHSTAPLTDAQVEEVVWSFIQWGKPRWEDMPDNDEEIVKAYLAARARRGEQKTETPPVAERVRGAPIITPAGKTPCPCRNPNCTSFHTDRPEYYYRARAIGLTRALHRVLYWVPAVEPAEEARKALRDFGVEE